MSHPGITDIVVDINDFVIVADMVQGVLFLAKNGGINLMVKQAAMDEKYLIRRFFDIIREVPAVTEYDNVYYYEKVEIPPILMDYLMDNDTDENILAKITDHIENNASWMEKRGWLAVAEMTFNSEMSTKYRMWNAENLRLLEQLSKHYTIHMLGNCNKRSLKNMIDLNPGVTDSIITSSDVRECKCSQSGDYVIYQKFLEHTDLNPDTTLFIEFYQGYIDALKLYNSNINTILYRGKDKKKEFIKELREYLGIHICYKYIKGQKTSF